MSDMEDSRYRAVDMLGLAISKLYSLRTNTIFDTVGKKIVRELEPPRSGAKYP